LLKRINEKIEKFAFKIFSNLQVIVESDDLKKRQAQIDEDTNELEKREGKLLFEIRRLLAAKYR
jgi:large-conductance mechanosensitive channel